MRKNRKFQITATVLFTVVITVAAITLGLPGHEDTSAPHASTSPAPAAAIEKSEKSAETKAAVLDPETLRQRVAGAWLTTGKPDPASELSATLDHHLEDTQQLLDKLSQANPQSTQPIHRQLASKQAEFQTVREETERWLASHGMQDSEQALLIAQRFDEVENALSAVIGATDSSQAQAIAAAQQTFQRLHPPRLGVRGDPQPTVTQGKPTTLTPDDFPNAPPPAYAAPPAAIKQSLTKESGTAFPVDTLANGFGDGLLRAMGISTARADAPSLTPPAEAASCGYATADIASALPEVDITDPDIQALAEKLGHSPLKIYAWIKNNIEFQPYFGSLKGALGTLKSGSGNATDQASLLIALMRVSGIPARYVLGEITLPEEAPLLDWIGTKTGKAAANRLASNQISTTYYTNTGGVAFIHVWTEVCVPYDNYRGSGGDNSGFHWIPLDPSFKEMAYTDGTTVADIPGFEFDYTDYLSTRTTVMPHEALRDQMEATLGRSLEHGGGYRGTIVQRGIDILPSTLPYEVKDFKAWVGSSRSDTATLPAEHRIQAEFAIKNKAGQPLAPKLTLDMPTLATQRLTLSFKGVTSANQNWIDNTWNGETKPCNTTTNTQAVFKLEGRDITPAGTRTTINFCSPDNRLSITVRRADEIYNSVNYRNIGGHNYHALQAYAFQASEHLLEERAAKLLNTVGTTPNPNTLRDETLGEYLHIVSLKYMGYITAANTQVGQLYGETGDSGNHIGLTSTKMKVSYLFDLPFAVSQGGFLVDVPGGQTRGINITDGTSDYASYLLSGYAGSAYEAFIWQEYARLDAVSTVRGIQYANDQGIPVVTLTSKADVETKLNLACSTTSEKLDYSSFDKTVLKQLFTDNYFRITLPGCRIHYDDWLGAVWVAEYSVGGNFKTSYKISGKYVLADGGYTVGGTTSLSYDPIRGTGYENLMPRQTFLGTFRPDSSSISYDVINLGNGSGTGLTLSTSFGGDPVNLVSGNMYQQERDIDIKGRGGLNIVFERFYNSHVRKDGPLGYGWTHSFNHYLKFFDETGNGKTNSIVWVDGTASTNTFTVAGTANGVPTNTTLTNPKGIYVTARREANGEYRIREKGGLTLYFANVPGKAGDTARLLRLVDRNGNTLRMNYNGDKLASVQDDLNRRLTFHYDNGDQHITRITDWSGRTFRYTYANNNLVRVDSPLAVDGQINSTTYAYYTAADGTNLDHAMRSFTRPTGYSMEFEYYTNGKTFRHTDSLGQSFTFRYNTFRRETTTVDERGISQTYLFNEWGQQLQHVQGDDSRTRYEYANSAHPLKETRRIHALGYETKNTYDAAGNLTKTTLPDGSTLEYFSYNAFGLPTRIKDTNGDITLHRYDTRGNRTDVITLKKGRNTTTPAPNDVLAWTINTYDTHGNLKTSKQVRDFATRAGPTIEYTYDGNALNPVTVKRCGLQQDASGTLTDHCVSISQTFDALGRPTKLATDKFYTQQRRYDANGRIIRATDATNRWRDFSYTATGQPAGQSLTGIDTDGRVALLDHRSTAFDALDRPVSQFDSAGHATHTEYDEVGNVTAITNPDGYTIRFEYDANNRPTRAFDEHGRAVSTDYDIGGRPIRVTDPNGNSTAYEYYGKEENGRLRRVTQADGQWLDYFYDRNGNVIRTRDNAGRENRTDYDALNRPVRRVGPVHNSHGLSNIRQVTLTVYDTLGFVKEIRAGYTTDTSGNPGSDVLSTQASYTSDDFGRRLTDTDGNGKVIRYTYDQYGNAVRKVSPNGHIIEWTYDHSRNGLLTKQTARRSSGDSNPHITTYAYNDLGQVTKVTSPEVTYIYRYDNANRLKTITDSRGNKTLRYDYSPGGQLTALIETDANGNPVGNGKRSDFLYDATRRLTAITTPNGEQVNFLFDAGGRLQETYLPNGVSARYQYDAGNKLTQLVNRTSQGIISQHLYGYDNVGRRTTHTETIAGTTTTHGYVYDNLDRLTKVLNGATPVETLTYDPYNNRRTRTAGGATHHYQHDAAQQLNRILTGSDTGSEAARFQYDANGNLTYQSQGGITRTYTYDALDRLTRVQGSDIATESYRYDPQGRRIEKTVAGTSTRYHYSGQSLWAEYQNWNQALAHYTYSGLDRPILRSTPNAADTRYYHHDGLGSIIATSNAAGATQASTRFDAWGNILNATGNTAPFGYTGQMPDASGLIHYRARYYDPALGRFTQPDPAGFADGINRYAYVGNSPTNFTDPLGLGRQAVTVGNGGTSTYAGNSNAPTVTSEGGFFDTVRNFGNSIVEEITFGANAVASGISEDYREGGSLGVIIGATGGRTNQGVFEQITENYSATSLIVGPAQNLDRTIASVLTGGAITRTYGGYSAAQYALRGPAPHLGTHAATARLVATTTVINSVVITGSYEFGNGIGSLIRSGINRAARALE